MKPELIAFSENVLGGIQTFYLNLLKNNPDNTFDQKWYLIDHHNEERAKAPDYELDNTKIKYNNNLGRWRKAWQLSKFISNKKGIILVNREFELDSLALYPKKNKTIYHIVHDDYYIKFAFQYKDIIDVFIAHNIYIYEELIRTIPSRKNDIHFIPFGIRLSPFQRKKNLSNKLKIAFIARLEKNKGIHDLILIDNLLEKASLKVEWLVIGDGSEKSNFLNTIENKNNFKHLIAKDDLEIFKYIQSCDIFILPSSHDGTPVALLESMSVGLVPIIYKFNEGIKNVVNSHIGYVVDINNLQEVAEIIISLNKNREHLEELSVNAIASTQQNFDAVQRSKQYFELFKKFGTHKKPINYIPPKPTHVLERRWFPQKIADLIKVAYRYIFK